MVIEIERNKYYMDEDEWKRIKAFRYYKEHTFPMSFEEWYENFYEESFS